ncbi:MAG TPA: hypothetical protein VLY63_19605, partial [Anaerolineae bacterium]|nr:hypothetical protein [Anaerolineae bacterium]
ISSQAHNGNTAVPMRQERRAADERGAEVEEISFPALKLHLYIGYVHCLLERDCPLPDDSSRPARAHSRPQIDLARRPSANHPPSSPIRNLS